MFPPGIVGELVVVALKAVAGKQDPLCVFRLGDVAMKTKTDVRGGQNPIWDDQVNLPVPVGATKLHMQLFDKNTNISNLIAEGYVDLSKVLREGEHDDFFPLTFRGKRAGEIYLELTFYSAVSHSFFFLCYKR
ncbi:C2 domain-containing protein [Radiomyces spectabilis]|uniref:C2 domain-containing protein n=1 Tax=Radiomyces spectabilis TaxID=64574 RepID=UPI002220F916|nr:C2 domain-containing protein [Radiomyces spectabilis]KAI8384452.1 C2 domain-containing protein [Radiomyces spectabilis]